MYNIFYLTLKLIDRIFTARADEEALGQPAKLTNQLFVQSANLANNNEDGATFVSVVSENCVSLVYTIYIT